MDHLNNCECDDHDHDHDDIDDETVEMIEDDDNFSDSLYDDDDDGWPGSNSDDNEDRINGHRVWRKVA